jgi:NAD(P)-dependent dehydrogenase (short-subunit alcohol dehydrogenase family)
MENKRLLPLSSGQRQRGDTARVGRSKTANILFAVEFNRRHRDRSVRATAVHPGGITTELSRHMPDGAIEAWVHQIQQQRAALGGPPFEFKTTPQGVGHIGLGWSDCTCS